MTSAVRSTGSARSRFTMRPSTPVSKSGVSMRSRLGGTLDEAAYSGGPGVTASPAWLHGSGACASRWSRLAATSGPERTSGCPASSTRDVRPARNPTRDSSLPASTLKRVDLPVLPPPLIATSSTGSGRSMAGSTLRTRRSRHGRWTPPAGSPGDSPFGPPATSERNAGITSRRARSSSRKA